MLTGDSTAVAGGQNIFAIGSPLGLDNTISQGIISNPNRVVDGLGYIQTTAPISHGSSGGALINDRGELIGITSAGFEDGQNLNLAVPISRYADLDTGSLKSLPIDGGSSAPDTGAGYYPGYYPAPDFGYYTGVPLYHTEDGIYFYRAVDMSDIDWCIEYYYKALTNQGFEYITTDDESYSEPVVYFYHYDHDMYVYVSVNYINGYECLEVCPYYSYEAN